MLQRNITDIRIENKSVSPNSYPITTIKRLIPLITPIPYEKTTNFKLGNTYFSSDGVSSESVHIQCQRRPGNIYETIYENP